MEIITEEPKAPNSGRDQSHKGASIDISTWQIVQMTDNPQKWKITDGSTNVADMFDSKEDAEQYVKWYDWHLKNPLISPNGEVATGNKAGDGVVIMAQIMPGGQQVTQFEVERSVHNQKHEKNIQRDSILGVPKMSKVKNVNIAQWMYFQAWLTADDQFDMKRCGGQHSGNGEGNKEKQGRCYPVGLMVKPGKSTTGYFAKEYPHHSDTPKHIEQIKYESFKEIPDVNGKTIGIQTIGWITGKKTYKMVCYIDKSVMDRNVDELVEPPNKWEKFFEVEDDGSFEGDPYLTNQGIEFGGGSMFMYGRLDHVTIDKHDKDNPTTKVKFAGACEISPLD